MFLFDMQLKHLLINVIEFFGMKWDSNIVESNYVDLFEEKYHQYNWTKISFKIISLELYKKMRI